MIWVGIIGAKGYFGEALARLVAGHPEAQLSAVMDSHRFGYGGGHTACSTEAGTEYRSIMSAVEKSDVIFSGLSGAEALDIYSKALSSGKKIIEISEENNSLSHPGSVYGLPEFYKDKMKDASIAANPSCYCAGAILGLAPLAACNLVDLDSAVIESISGIASLRRNDKLIEAGLANDNGMKTYKIEHMGYAEEVNEQIMILFGKETSVSYDSYIIPGTKGIITTIKVKPGAGINVNDIVDTYRDFYINNPFVQVCSNGMTPDTSKGLNKYFCKIRASVDGESGNITVTTVLDDALRGAASQVIQTMNLMCGIDGKTGL